MISIWPNLAATGFRVRRRAVDSREPLVDLARPRDAGLEGALIRGSGFSLPVEGSAYFEGVMPIFEFRCRACGKRFSALIGMTAEADDTRCPNCGAIDADKLVSRFARYRNEDDRIDEVADQLELMGEPDSPSAMREMVRSMGKAMDEDVSDEMEEMLEADLEGGADE